MKKFIAVISAAVLSMSVFTACMGNNKDNTVMDAVETPLADMTQKVEDGITNKDSADNNNSKGSTDNKNSKDNKDNKASFTIENATGMDFTEIYISEGSMEKWEDNLIPQDGKLENGHQITVELELNENIQDWDIKAGDAKGNYIYWDKVNIRDAKRITLKNDNGESVIEVSEE